jgi:hypothetical protein
MFSMAIVPLYDTLGFEACEFIINQSKNMYRVSLIQLATVVLSDFEVFAPTTMRVLPVPKSRATHYSPFI